MTKRGKVGHLMINGQRYDAVVMQVIKKEGALPREFRILLDNEKAEIKGGEEFFIMFARRDLIDRRN